MAMGPISVGHSFIDWGFLLIWSGAAIRRIVDVYIILHQSYRKGRHLEIAARNKAQYGKASRESRAKDISIYFYYALLPIS